MKTKIPATLGFMYTPDFKEVLLIKKTKPEQHKGKLNGLGGKCEPREKSLDCIMREVKEESGLVTLVADWKKIGTISWDSWKVDIFVSLFRSEMGNIASLTDDEVGWYPVEDLPSHVLSNLRWLIPLGIDHLTNDSPPMVKVQYR